MKRTLQTTVAGLLLGAMALGGMPAHAATTVDTTAFSLALADATPADVSLELVSADAGTVRIRLDNLQASPFVLTSGEGTVFDAETAFAQLSGQVHAGYRITSLTFNLTASGNLDVPIYEACAGCTLLDAGSAVNSGGYDWSVTANAITSSDGDGNANLDGMQFHSSTVTRSLTGAFGIDTQFAADSSASPLIWQQATPFGMVDHVEASSASFYIGNAELVIQVAAVPEPGTWAMLLGGLALLGVAARQRRS